MQPLHAQQLIALCLTKHRFRNIPPDFMNSLDETLSSFFVASLGKSRAWKGWRSKPYKFFGKHRVGTHSIGYRTRADINSGWDGGLSIRKSKETKEFRPYFFTDDPTRVGLESHYIILQWGGIWAKRKLKGWSLQAICTCFLKYELERPEFDALSIGVPLWFSQHQP